MAADKECGCKGPFYPLQINNGSLTAKNNRHAPTTDVDHTPREFRRQVDASGWQHMQAFNGLQRRIGQGLRGPMNLVSYLYAAMPIIPGQTRDNYAGGPPKGIDPLSYQQLWDNGPGSQPANPGGVGRIAAEYFINPGTC